MSCKIHFASLVGIDYDLDLAPAWMEYYLMQGFDSYTVFLHRENGDIPSPVISDYKNAGFIVKTADGPFGCGCIRSALLRNFADNLPENDILVTADADEFQALSDGSPIPYRSMLSRHDVLWGLLEDRYAYTLENCYGFPFSQYTLVEEYTGEHIKKLSIPHLGNGKKTDMVRTKILAAPACAPVEFKGSHIMGYVRSDYRLYMGCKVIHFAWRENASRKIALKPYFPKDNLQALYKNNIPHDLLNVYDTVASIMNATDIGSLSHEMEAELS